jgi:hypothetical protein
MPEPSYLKDLEDSQPTTIQVFRRTADQAQFIAGKRGRVTRYYMAEVMTREFNKLTKKQKDEFFSKYGQTEGEETQDETDS